MQGVERKNIDPTYWKTALFSSSNPKKVNGAMNTNINNKKFKLVPLRNQPMQAFACKRECDKEASGETMIEGGRVVKKKGESWGRRQDKESWRKEMGDESRGGLGTGEKKNYDDPSSDSFSFLATLKKPMDVISESRRVS